MGSPFEIEERIGYVAYRLRLPAGSAIHPVIYVSQLKKYIGHGTNVSPTLSITSLDDQLKIFSEYILTHRAIK
jgi:hypothetical protein